MKESSTYFDKVMIVVLPFEYWHGTDYHLDIFEGLLFKYLLKGSHRYASGIFSDTNRVA